MATGAPGTNGVWQYGEDDSEATFSDLLNLAAASADSSIGDDRARLTTLEALPLAGLVPISPSSVVIATGSGSANAKGQVSFTGATAVSLNGVFTSAYKNYRVVVNTSVSSAALTITMRLRAAGTDYTAGEYHRMMTTTNSAGATASAASSAASSLIIGSVSNATNAGAGAFDITDPQTTVRKTVNSIFSGYSGSNPAAFYGGGYINSTSSYDGLTYAPATGTISGTIQVFGYND